MSRRKPAPKHRTGAPRGDARVTLYGAHPVLAALHNPARRIRRVLVTADARRRLGEALDGACGAAKLSPEVVDRDALDRHAPEAAPHQGLVALAEPLAPPSLDDVLETAGRAERATLVMLDQVTDPQNVGAVLRAAAVFGASAAITTQRNAPPETGALAKAASGGLEHVPLVRETNLARAIDSVRAAGFHALGFAGDADPDLPTAAGDTRTALVLGAEGAGLRRLTRERVDQLVRIPAPGALPELNVATAAAVALYEVHARRVG